jgi:alpha/beta hydrolase fold
MDFFCRGNLPNSSLHSDAANSAAPVSLGVSRHDSHRLGSGLQQSLVFEEVTMNPNYFARQFWGVSGLLIRTMFVLAISAYTLATEERGMKQLDRATIEDIQLEYKVLGAGEPVMLMHAGIFADWFKPLLEEPALTGRYRVVSYHRIGYAGSSHVAGPVSIAQQAAHLRALMRHLGIQCAHIVGHSSGGNIAL